MRTLILGMGNPILSDDGVGFHIAMAMEGRLRDSEVRTTNLIGLHLLDLISGYDRVLVVDAIQTGRNPPGAVERLMPGEESLHLFSSHGFHFFEVLQLGKDLGYNIPKEIALYGIEIGKECPFGEGLSPELMDKKEHVIQKIIEDINLLC